MMGGVSATFGSDGLPSDLDLWPFRDFAYSLAPRQCTSSLASGKRSEEILVRQS
jgi:hypothetical protein